MAQQLRILQSIWAMERRLADQPEWPLQTQLAMIRDAGYDGVGVRFMLPMLGPVPIALDFGFPIVKASTDHEQVFSFWLGFFR